MGMMVVAARQLSSIFRNYARDGYFPFTSYEWGPSANDERHLITLAGVVDLPKRL